MHLRLFTAFDFEDAYRFRGLVQEIIRDWSFRFAAAGEKLIPQLRSSPKHGVVVYPLQANLIRSINVFH